MLGHFLGTLGTRGVVVLAFPICSFFLWPSSSFVLKSSFFFRGFIGHSFIYGHIVGQPFSMASICPCSFLHFALFFRGFPFVFFPFFSQQHPYF